MALDVQPTSSLRHGPPTSSSDDLLEIALLRQDLCSNLGMCKDIRRYKLWFFFVTLLASFLNYPDYPVSNSQTSVKPKANWMARVLLLFPAVHRALSAGHASLIVSRALWKLEMLQVVEIWAKNCQTIFFWKETSKIIERHHSKIF